MDTKTTDHKLQRRIRWTAAAEAAVATGPGDIVEIGAMTGDSTVLFCEIAEKYGRKVLVVDQWTAGTQNCRGHEYDIFMRRTKDWQDKGILDVVKLSSQEPRVIRRLIDGTWAFALVDGSHKYADVLCDAMSVRASRVICFDDMNARAVKKAYECVLELLPQRIGYLDESLGRKWEAYIV